MVSGRGTARQVWSHTDTPQPPKKWRKAESVCLVSVVEVRDELGLQVPLIGITMSHQPSEQMLLHSNMCFAHVFSPLPGHYILEDHHVEMHPGITVSSYR